EAGEGVALQRTPLERQLRSGGGAGQPLRPDTAPLVVAERDVLEAGRGPLRAVDEEPDVLIRRNPGRRHRLPGAVAGHDAVPGAERVARALLDAAAGHVDLRIARPQANGVAAQRDVVELGDDGVDVTVFLAPGDQPDAFGGLYGDRAQG